MFEAVFGFGEIDTGNGNSVETQFGPPLSYACNQWRKRRVGCVDSRGIGGRIGSRVYLREIFMTGTTHTPDDSDARIALHLAAEQDTLDAGALLAKALQPGLKIWLRGNLGCGKTTLTRGVLRGLGYAGKVKSPTYTLIEPYVISRLNLYHFDFYRFNSPDEYLDAGLDEYFSESGICLVEWPEKALPHLAQPDLEFHLAPDGVGRRLEAVAATEAGRTCLNKLIETLRRRQGNPQANNP